MVGGVVLLATIYYIIWGRKLYTPPNETIEDYTQRYEGTTLSEKEEPVEVVEGEVETKRLDM